MRHFPIQAAPVQRPGAFAPHWIGDGAVMRPYRLSGGHVDDPPAWRRRSYAELKSSGGCGCEPCRAAQRRAE